MKYIETLKAGLQTSIQAKQALIDLPEPLKVFSEAAKVIVEAYRHGGRLYIAGNGGSAADAQHFAAELVSKLARDRGPLPAEALTVDTSILTAIGNDYGYDELFSRQIRGKMRENDVFLGITTSGNSKNILSALKTCKELKLKSIVFSGHQGGQAAALADHCVIAPGKETATIQEVHLVLIHTMCLIIENEMFSGDVK